MLAVSSLLVAAVLAPAPIASAEVSWTKLANGTLAGISGLAPTQTGWLIVRDNKGAGQNRIALLSSSYSLTTLTWPGTQPQDLEALDAVPGQPGQFVAMTSAGKASVLSISGDNGAGAPDRYGAAGDEQHGGVRDDPDRLHHRCLWANRGSSSQPGKVFASTFNPATTTFGPVATGQVKVPFPVADARQISDLKIVSGRLVVSSASDPGSNGPFSSALYDVGSIGLTGSRTH